VPQDRKEALRLYRHSAELGNIYAQYNLGMVYKNGEGVPQDDTLAHMWWNIAGSKGHEEATDKRVLLEKIMTESQIKKANELARKRKSKTK
jgi:TPR repeat protein